MFSRAKLIEDLRGSLHDSAHVFAEDETVFERCVSTALQAYSRLKPRQQVLGLAWSFGAPAIDVSDGIIRVASLRWSDNTVASWKQRGYLTPPAPLQYQLIQATTGPQLLLTAPQHGQCPNTGRVNVNLHLAHVLAADDSIANITTVDPADEWLILMRAEVEALRVLANRNVTKTVSMRDGQSQGPRNGTPAALYNALLQEWTKAMHS